MNEIDSEARRRESLKQERDVITLQKSSINIKIHILVDRQFIEHTLEVAEYIGAIVFLVVTGGHESIME